MKNFHGRYVMVLLLIGIICCLISVCVSLVVKEKTHVHSYDEWVFVSNPTCTEAGLRERFCSCGSKQESIVAALGHDCVSVEGKPATCTDGGYKDYVICTRCNFNTFEETQATGHIFSEWEEIIAPTCTVDGLTRRVCSVCSEEEEQTVSATGHLFSEWEQITAVTCTIDGLNRRVCSVCSEEEEQTVSATGHLFGEWEQITAVTCTIDGLNRRECSECHEKEEQSVDAVGHNYGEWFEVTALSCLSEGVEKRVCSRDETHCEIRITPKLAHTPTVWLTEKPATCTENGIEYIRCSVCASQLDTRPIKALGHAFGEWFQVKAPSCSSFGMDQRVCLNDGTHVETREVQKTAHTPSEWITDKAAACGIEGVRNKDCVVCGEKLITDSIAALEHKFEIFSNEYVHYSECKLCHTVTESQPHTWDDNNCLFCGFDAGGIKGLEWTLGTNGSYYILTGMGNVKVDIFEVPSVHNGKKVTAIGRFAFNSFEGTAITVPTFITHIETGAFFGCNGLRELKLPFIGNDEKTALNLGCLFGSDGISDNMEYVPQSLKTVEILNGIKQIADEAFKNCTSIEKIILPSTVESLGESCFYNCMSLNEITLPVGLKTIGSGAFWACGSLKRIEIPASVEELGKGAFYGVAEDAEIIFNDRDGWTLYENGKYIADIPPDYLSGENVRKTVDTFVNYTWKRKK